MKKFLSLLVVLAMLMAIATSAFAMGMVGGMAEMALGENVVEMPVYYDEEYDEYYPMPANLMWVVTEDGSLTIDLADDDVHGFYANIYVSDAEGNMDMSGIYEKGGAATVDVVVGDTVMMEVGCMDKLTEEGTITAHFTLSMGAGESGVAGSGTEEDPWVVTSLEAPMSAEFATAEAADAGAYFTYTAAEDGVMTMTEWFGLVFIYRDGFWQTMVDGAENGFEVAAGETVYVCISGYAEGSYYAAFTFEAGAAEGGEVEETVVLTRGDNTFVIPGGSYYGGVFTAHVAGTLTVTITEFMVYDEEAGDYVLVEDPFTYFSRMGYYDLLVNDEDANDCVYTVEVEAGEEVSVFINAAMGSDAMAGVNLYLEPAEEGGEEENDTPASGTVDVTADAPIVYELVVEADGTVSIAVSSTTGWEVHIGNADGSVDNRYWSDSNTSPVTEALAAGVYTVTIYGYDEVTWDYVDATITYDITFAAAGEGGEEGGEEEPSCTHESVTMEWDSCYEDPMMFDIVEICDECGEEVARYLPGQHELNPILVDFEWDYEGTTATATVTVPAGETVWFGQKRIAGMLLTINGVEYGIVEDRGSWDPSVFAITNDGTEEASYELVLTWPMGTEMNPDELVLGEAFQVVLEENNNGYYYHWVATEEGVLTVTVEGDFWMFNVNYASFMEANGDSNTYNLLVMPGDEVLLSVGTQKIDGWDWSTPASTLTVTASFAVPAPTPLELGDNEMEYGKYSFTATQSGTLYYCFTTLYIDGEENSENRKDLFGEWEYVYLLVNGEPVENGYYGYLEVSEGDEVIFLFNANEFYSVYTGVLNLSYENNNPALGSQERPVYLEYKDFPTTSVEIAPGAEAWFELSGDFYDADATVTIKGVNACVVVSYYDWDLWEYVDQYIYPSEDGVIVLEAKDYTEFRIMNVGTEAAAFEMEAYIPLSHAGNPDDLVLGDNVAEVEEDRPDMYYFEWTAPADGTLFVTAAGENWMLFVVNPVTGEMTEPLFFYNDPLVDTIEWTVKAGDRVMVAVATCINYNDIDWTDPDLVYPVAPAGTITVTAAFACAHSNVVHMEAVEPGCHFEGHVEHWVCYDCGGVWTDEALTRVSNSKSVILPELGGEVVHVEAKDPTCTEDGNIEHWYCEECQQVWQDEARTQLTNHMNVKRGATGHTFVDGVCSVCGENDQNVPPTSDMIAMAFALVAISGMAVIALPKKKED